MRAAELTIFCLFISAYHYAGYPLLVWLWAKLAPHPPVAEAFQPTVSLIIAAYNEAAVIAAKIDNSLALDYPAGQLEIVVVSDGSNDETPTIVQNYQTQGVRLLHRPGRQGKSAAINRAAAQATGDILLFSDANAFYEPQAVARLVRHFADPTVGGVSGKKSIRQNESGVSQPAGFYWRYESAIKQWESQSGATVAVVGEMMAIRRALFQPLPADIINDDAYLATRLLQQGLRVLYEPEAVCWETAVETMEAELIRRKRINAGRYQLLFRPQAWWGMSGRMLWSLISHKFLRLLLPLVMVVGFLANGWAVWLKVGGRLLRWAWLGQLAIGGLGLLGLLAHQRGQRWKIPSIVYYFLSSQFAVLQGLVGYCSGRETVLWKKTR